MHDFTVWRFLPNKNKVGRFILKSLLTYCQVPLAPKRRSIIKLISLLASSNYKKPNYEIYTGSNEFKRVTQN